MWNSNSNLRFTEPLIICQGRTRRLHSLCLEYIYTHTIFVYTLSLVLTRHLQGNYEKKLRLGDIIGLAQGHTMSGKGKIQNQIVQLVGPFY